MIDLAIAALNNTARVQNIAGDQRGVLGDEPLYRVTNPEDVVRAVLAAIREPTPEMIEAHDEAHATAITFFAEPRDVWRAMIDAALK